MIHLIILNKILKGNFNIFYNYITKGFEGFPMNHRSDFSSQLSHLDNFFRFIAIFQSNPVRLSSHLDLKWLWRSDQRYQHQLISVESRFWVCVYQCIVRGTSGGIAIAADKSTWMKTVGFHFALWVQGPCNVTESPWQLFGSRGQVLFTQFLEHW